MWRGGLSCLADSGSCFLNSLLLGLEMCLFFKLSRLSLFLPICPGDDSKMVL